MNDYPLISIQILNWNRAEETQLAIASAYVQTYPNIEVILIDNGSNDNSVSLTRKNYPNLKIIGLDHNFGCPGGRNKGINHCNGDFIFYLDNDGQLHKDAVLNAYNTIIYDNKIGVVTGVTYDYKFSNEIDICCKIKCFDLFETRLFQGGICMHRKVIYDKIGFYPDHFIYGSEESFMSLKLLDNDYKIVKDFSVILWHKQSILDMNRTSEILNSYFNKLYIAISLYPLRYAILFVVYFIFKYPLYAYKTGIFKNFIGSYQRCARIYLKALKNRHTIKIKTYKLSKTKDVNISISVNK